MKFALSALCENPNRRTGQTTLFQEMVRHALVEFPDVRWLVFAGPNQSWAVDDPRVEVCRDFPANDRLGARLWADHFGVGPAARRLGADVLLTVGFVPVRAPLPVAMQVITLHHRRKGAEGVGWARAIYRARAVRSGLRRAMLVIANSEWTASHLRAAAPEVAGKLIRSYEGLAHAQFHPIEAEGEAARLRAALGVPQRYLLWSGNFYTYKHAEKLFAAYARLAPERRKELPLVMIGGAWGAGRALAEAAARQLGVAETVQFLGWVDDEWLAPLYRHARAHVLPSGEETFGKSVTEAMACGCPCVLNDIAVLREVSGGAARMVNFDDAIGAGAVLQEIDRDDALTAQMRFDGLKRAAEFSYERLVRERVGGILKSLAARNA